VENLMNRANKGRAITLVPHAILLFKQPHVFGVAVGAHDVPATDLRTREGGGGGGGGLPFCVPCLLGFRVGKRTCVSHDGGNRTEEKPTALAAADTDARSDFVLLRPAERASARNNRYLSEGPLPPLRVFRPAIRRCLLEAAGDDGRRALPLVPLPSAGSRRRARRRRRPGTRRREGWKSMTAASLSSSSLLFPAGELRAGLLLALGGGGVGGGNEERTCSHLGQTMFTLQSNL